MVFYAVIAKNTLLLRQITVHKLAICITMFFNAVIASYTLYTLECKVLQAVGVYRLNIFFKFVYKTYTFNKWIF